jgi:protein CpxP
MNFPSLRLALVAGLVLPLGLATASLAQDAPPPPPPPGADMHRGHHWDPAKMREHMAGRLRAELQLQPSQEGALAAFLDAMKPPGDMQGRTGRGHDEMEHLTTPERLDKMVAHVDEMRARLVAHAGAVKQFYAQLSPSQQKAFDAMHMGHHDGMGGMRGHGGDRRGGEHEMGPGGPPQG